ncbi:MAG: hypothetical protein JOZ10_06200, partial [Acidobacteria bacterium]|nr:hypothetical protein [Acidobacteriota bacterium]
MTFQLRSKVLTALLPAVCLLTASAFDYKPPEIQPAGHADKYPQHETHKDEGV